MIKITLYQRFEVYFDKTGFLKKLHKEVFSSCGSQLGKKTAYLKKSESNLTSARLQFDNDLFEQSVSMAYYSMYYSVMRSFLPRHQVENHTAAKTCSKRSLRSTTRICICKDREA